MSMFRRNVGGLDRILRVTFGPILVLAGLVLLTGRTSLGLVLTVVGGLALVTGITRFCVLYIPFGISTARSKKLRERYGCDCMASLREAPSRIDKAPTAEEKDDELVGAGNPTR
jgi:Inner membrane protein YgaP-like, transmembrane domain